MRATVRGLSRARVAQLHHTTSRGRSRMVGPAAGGAGGFSSASGGGGIGKVDSPPSTSGRWKTAHGLERAVVSGPSDARPEAAIDVLGAVTRELGVGRISIRLGRGAPHASGVADILKRGRRGSFVLLVLRDVDPAVCRGWLGRGGGCAGVSSSSIALPSSSSPAAAAAAAAGSAPGRAGGATAGAGVGSGV